MADERFDLADVIVNLRQTLKRAEDKGAEEDLKFLVGEIEVELKVAVTEEEGGDAGAGRRAIADLSLSAPQRRPRTVGFRLPLQKA